MARTLVRLARAGDLETMGGGSSRQGVTAAHTATGARPGPADARRWFAAGTLAAVETEVAGLLGRRAGQRPENPFVPLAEIAAAVPRFPLGALAVVAARLAERGELVERDGGYALPGAGDALAPAHEALAARVGERLAAARFAPPTLASLEEELAADKRDLVMVLEVLTRRGAAVRVDRDLWFDRAAVDEARQRLVEALARLVEITLAQYRDVLATGRRHAQALLELFDKEGLTRRRGEVRVLRERR